MSNTATKKPLSPGKARPTTRSTTPSAATAAATTAAATDTATPEVGKAKRIAAAEPVAHGAGKAGKQRARLVRDSFTMPEADFALIATLKALAMDHKRAAKKSELLRAGLHALAALDGEALIKALEALQPLKVGRPKKGH